MSEVLKEDNILEVLMKPFVSDYWIILDKKKGLVSFDKHCDKDGKFKYSFETFGDEKTNFESLGLLLEQLGERKPINVPGLTEEENNELNLLAKTLDPNGTMETYLCTLLDIVHKYQIMVFRKYMEERKFQELQELTFTNVYEENIMSLMVDGSYDVSKNNFSDYVKYVETKSFKLKSDVAGFIRDYDIQNNQYVKHETYRLYSTLRDAIDKVAFGLNLLGSENSINSVHKVENYYTEFYAKYLEQADKIYRVIGEFDQREDFDLTIWMGTHKNWVVSMDTLNDMLQGDVSKLNDIYPQQFVDFIVTVLKSFSNVRFESTLIAICGNIDIYQDLLNSIYALPNEQCAFKLDPFRRERGYL